MAFSGVSKKFTDFGSTTSASDSDVILKSDSNGEIKKVSISSLANILKSKIIGTTSMGTTASTVTGAIAELKKSIGTGGLPSDFFEEKICRIPAKNLIIPPGDWIISTTDELSPGKYMIMAATGFTQYNYNANFKVYLTQEDWFQSDPPEALSPPTGKVVAYSNHTPYINGVFTVDSTYPIVSILCSNNSNGNITFVPSNDDKWFYWKIYKLK